MAALRDRVLTRALSGVPNHHHTPRVPSSKLISSDVRPTHPRSSRNQVPRTPPTRATLPAPRGAPRCAARPGCGSATSRGAERRLPPAASTSRELWQLDSPRKDPEAFRALTQKPIAACRVALTSLACALRACHALAGPLIVLGCRLEPSAPRLSRETPTPAAHEELLELLSSQPPTSKRSSRPSSTSAKMTVHDASAISSSSPVASPWLDLAGCVL